MMTSELTQGKIGLGVGARGVEDGPKVSTPKNRVRTPAMRERMTKPKVFSEQSDRAHDG